MYLGIDTGGTFTDFILFDESTLDIRIHKVLSTPSDPAQSILQGIRDMGLEGRAMKIVHGSTVATNAVLEGKGVPTAYVTNRGLGDVLSIGRQAREELYNLTPEKKPPLIPRDHCLEVDSRLGADGEHLERLTQAGIAELLKRLETLAPKAVAINLLFSFLDDSEERRIEQAICDQWQDAIFISRSSDVLPEYKEYERGMTTVLNALVGPLMQGYLRRLEASLEGSQLSIMQSSGGTTSVEHAGQYPVHLLLSGPAGGLTGAQYVAGESDDHEERLLTFDMGGTSTDVSIIDRAIGFRTETRIGGHPVSVPMVDMHTIGAGGGSLARVDAGGLLLVGPESAGADPGPACYGKGGTEPAVTDANVVLGRLLPDAFLGGHMTLDKDNSLKAVGRIAEKLGIDVYAAAKGIIDIVNDHMVRALRVMSVQRGEDPKDYTLVSFGGAGGLHVCALADALEMQHAVVPVNAGVLSALGMLVAQPLRDRSRSINRLIEDCGEAEIIDAYDQLKQTAEAEMLEPDTLTEPSSANAPTLPRKRGSSMADLTVRCTADVRYKGQSNTLNLPWKNLEQLERAFHLAHEDNYGHRMDIPVELVNLRVRLLGKASGFKLPQWQPEQARGPEHTHVEVFGFEQAVPVHQREVLPTGRTIEGPALITEVTSTTWVEEGWTARVDRIGNLLLVRRQSSG